MSSYLLFALIGLGSGAVYAGLGNGLVVAYKGTGVVNFAQGALAMWGAYVYEELRNSGDLVLPLVGIPARYHLAAHVPVAAAVAAGVVSAALLGLAAHLLVFRPLRRAPLLAKVVASVGVMLTLEAIATLRFGSEERVVPGFLPAGIVQFASVAIPRDRFYLAAIALAAAALLWAYFRFTLLGLATRAAAESERNAGLLGLSPDLLAGSAWLLAGALAGIFGILLAPITGLNTVDYTLFVIPALAVALVGRLTSLAVTCLAGITLGMVQSEVVFLQTKPWYPGWAVSGATTALPFLVIVAALFLRGRGVPSRGALEWQRLPQVARPRRVLLPASLSAVAGAALLVLLNGSYRFGLIESMILATIMLSIVVLTGFVGQISLAQAAFAGTAGFALSRLTEGAHVPFPLSPLLAAALAGVLGVAVGIPALRIRGAQLAVVTLAAAVAIEQFVFSNPSFTPLAGNLIPSPKLLGLDLGIRNGHELVRLPFGFLTLAVLAGAAVFVANLSRAGTGRRFLAVRSNERAAAAAGVNVAATKLVAFALSSTLAGLGGALIGYSRGQLSASSFDVFTGLQFLAFAYLGGITSIGGALVAGTLAPLGIGYVVLNRLFALDRWYLLLSGVSLIAIAIFNPEGIAGAVRLAAERVRRRPSVEPQPPPAAQLRLAHKPPTPPGDNPGGGPLLDVRQLTVSYGGLRAVDQVSLEVGQGQIVGLIGANGAGKTTLLDALSGFARCSGSVHFAGRPIGELPAHARARLGLTRTWQSLELFDDLSVRENLLVAVERPRPGALVRDAVHLMDTSAEVGVRELLAELGLDTLADRRPGSLSLAEQKRLGIARALVSEPRLVLLDEPAAGLGNEESRALGDDLAALRARDVAVLLVEHDVDLVLTVCDLVYVLDFGRLIAHGTPAEIRRDEAVIAAYLGQNESSGDEAAVPA